MSNTRLNLAGLLAQYFVTSRITGVFGLACLLLGLFAVAVTPREENPQTNIPAADIVIVLPGASPLEVEKLILQPLENIIKQIDGIDNVYGTASAARAIVSVQFKADEDREQALVRLYDHVMGQRNNLPPDASIPIVKSMAVDNVPVVSVTLASARYDDYALKKIADQMLLGLRSIESVSASYVKGGRDREVRVEFDPNRAKAFGVSFTQVIAAIKVTNIALPTGTFIDEGISTKIMLEGRLEDVDGLNRLVVGVHNKQPIYLADIATVVDGASRLDDTLSRLAFGPADRRFKRYDDPELPAVTLALAKQKGANVVDVAEEVLVRIEAMKNTLVPADIEVVVTRNHGKRANDAVNDLIGNLGIAILAVLLVTIFFLGWKEAVIIGFTVPLSLALTLAADYLHGVSINRISLLTLIFSIGIMVDASIVVAENIHRHYVLLGKGDKRKTTVLATNEIGNATNLATFAVMLCFLSQNVMTGMPGQYFYPFAFNVPVAMLASVFVAYTITPWACYKWLNPANLSGSHNKPATVSKSFALTGFYRWALNLLLDRPRLRLGVFALIFTALCLALLQSFWQFVRPAGVGGPQSPFGVAVTLLPRDNKNTFNITITMPPTTAAEITDQAAREIGTLLRTNAYVSNYQTWIGQAGVIDFNGLMRGASYKQGPHIAEIRVNISDKNKREITSIEIARDLRPHIQNIQKEYPGSLMQVVEDPPGPPILATVQAEIYGRDLDTMNDIAGRVETRFLNTYDMIDVYNSVPNDSYEYRITVDREKAALAGISSVEIARTLLHILDGEVVSRLHVDDEENPVPIKLEVPYQPQGLSMIYVSGPQGGEIPLSELVSFELVPADKPIFHKNYERVVYVSGEMAQSSPVYAVLSLNEQLDGLELAEKDHLTTDELGFDKPVPNSQQGYQLFWGGEQRMTLDTFGGMINAFSLTILMIYLMLVAYYQSFRIPLIAMSAVPLGLIGILPGHWLLGQMFTATSMIGIIALAGIVVRNSLLIIDFVLTHLKEGMSLRDAAVQGALLRLRPMLLTALSTTLGTIIVVGDTVFGGMAISLIAGTLIATFLTILVVPLLLHQMLDKEQNLNPKVEPA